MNCSECGKEIPEGSIFCSKCGVKLGDPQHSQSQKINSEEKGKEQFRTWGMVYPKNPPISPHNALLSMLVPGIGQIVFGQTLKGIMLIVLSFLGLATLLGYLVLAVITTIDAYKTGYLLASGRPVRKWAWFPTKDSEESRRKGNR